MKVTMVKWGHPTRRHPRLRASEGTPQQHLRRQEPGSTIQAAFRTREPWALITYTPPRPRPGHLPPQPPPTRGSREGTARPTGLPSRAQRLLEPGQSGTYGWGLGPCPSKTASKLVQRAWVSGTRHAASRPRAAEEGARRQEPAEGARAQATAAPGAAGPPQPEGPAGTSLPGPSSPTLINIFQLERKERHFVLISFYFLKLLCTLEFSFHDPAPAAPAVGWCDHTGDKTGFLTPLQTAFPRQSRWAFLPKWIHQKRQPGKVTPKDGPPTREIESEAEKALLVWEAGVGVAGPPRPPGSSQG